MKDTISFKFQLTFLLELLQLDEHKIDKKNQVISVLKSYYLMIKNSLIF